MCLVHGHQPLGSSSHEFKYHNLHKPRTQNTPHVKSGVKVALAKAEVQHKRLEVSLHRFGLDSPDG